MKLKIKENAEELYYKRLNSKKSKYVGFTKAERDFGDKIKAIQGQWIDVETDYLWDDQYNTVPIHGVSENGLRILDFDNESEFSIIEAIEGDERFKRKKCIVCGNYERSDRYLSREQTGKCWWCGSKE